MQTESHDRRQEVPAISEKDREMARVAQRCIMESLDHSRAAAITLTTEDGSQPSIEVPPAALRLFGQLLGAMSEGKTINLVPAEREFTTVEAAHFLNVSRPFVVKLIKQGELPCRMVGTHRRIAFDQLLACKQRMQSERHEALDRMANDARELGLDY